MLTDKLSAFISHDPATYRAFIVYLFFIYLFVYCCKFGCRATGLRVGSTLIIMDNGNREDPFISCGTPGPSGISAIYGCIVKNSHWRKAYVSYIGHRYN